MVYATQADLVNAYGEQRLLAIADRDNDDVIDADVVTQAIAEASQLVDSYISDYLANLVLVPSLRRATVAIAYEFLHGSNQSNEDSRLGYDRAIKWLKDIASGAAELPGQPNTEDGVVDPGDPLIVAGERVWDRQIAGRLF